VGELLEYEVNHPLEPFELFFEVHELLSHFDKEHLPNLHIREIKDFENSLSLYRIAAKEVVKKKANQ